MTVNAPLLTRTLDLVRRHEVDVEKPGAKSWYQSMWRMLVPLPDSPRCRTAMCYAGWTVEANHGTWLISASDAAQLTAGQRNAFGDLVLLPKAAKAADHLGACLLKEWSDWQTLPDVLAKHADRLVQHASAYAQQHLGLTDYQAAKLFQSGNDLGDLQALVNEFVASS